uniref:Uncharacterized protein n=1 Tax=Rhabditophanes sp. KR3021 TaxID=114890 RepID=A0AC35UHJ9_9BILA
MVFEHLLLDDSGSYSESDNDENTFRKRKHSPVQVCVDDDFNKKRMLQKQQYQPLVIA